MRHTLWLAAILLPVGGCYLPPATPEYGYAQPGYAAPGYDQPGYEQQGYEQPAYPQGAYDPYAGYPGYSYNNGAPVIVESGVPTPLVFFGGEWGFYDHDRHWHRAPDHVSRDLDSRRGGGGPPNPGPRPDSFHDGRPPGGDPYHGQPHGYPQHATPAAAPAPGYPAPAPHAGPPPPQAHPQEQQHHCDPRQRC